MSTTIAGTSLSDVLRARSTEESYIIRGGGGNDYCYGNCLNDFLYGGDGDDYLSGGPGDDQFFGGNGMDTVSYYYSSASSPNFYVHVNLSLTGVQNTVGSGQERLSGIENLIGSNRGDRLLGNSANNQLTGMGGNDWLAGRNGEDRLVGSAGNDTLLGEMGNDWLMGGDGADLFAFNSNNAGTDTIVDFSATQHDKLVFYSQNFGHLAAGTLPANRLAVNAEGSATSANTRFILQTGSGNLYYDADGTGAAEALWIATLNVQTLSSANIQIVGTMIG